MNWFVNLLVVAAAGAVGYFAEPSLRQSLTGFSPAGSGSQVANIADPSDTDLHGQLADNPPPSVSSTPEIAAAPEPAAPIPPEPAPLETSAPDLAVFGDKPSAMTIEIVNTPTAAEFTPLPPEDIVKIMQQSIRSAQIKEFSFDSVTDWTAGETEKLDDKEFNTGIVSYQGKTFLGVKTIQAKAYITDNKVVRWIMPKSGMEIK